MTAAFSLCNDNRCLRRLLCARYMLKRTDDTGFARFPGGEDCNGYISLAGYMQGEAIERVKELTKCS
jgi:hypothetical protein